MGPSVSGRCDGAAPPAAKAVSPLRATSPLDSAASGRRDTLWGIRFDELLTAARVIVHSFTDRGLTWPVNVVVFGHGYALTAGNPEDVRVLVIGNLSGLRSVELCSLPLGRFVPPSPTAACPSGLRDSALHGCV